MKLKLFMTFFGVLTACCVQADTLVLNKSIPGRYDEGYRTPEQQAAIIKLVDIFKKAGEYQMGMLGYVQYQGDEWYSLNRRLNIQGGDVANQEYLGNWPLTPWAYNQQPKEITDRADMHGTIADSFVAGTKYPVGCYGDTPLNYGDLDNDGTNELILFMGNTLVAFSPQYGRTIFSTWLSLNDWARAEENQSYYEGEYGENLKTAEDPQYDSNLVHNRGRQEDHVPGYRGYSKIYVGDFDKDNNIDILVWRKMYISKMENDSQRGFTLIRNEWNHFERDLAAQKASTVGVTGEYLPQDTAQETIQNWLAAANLTWSKGFPSKSECPGEEGKLISEMHDPLLNDPDVLQ